MSEETYELTEVHQELLGVRIQQRADSIAKWEEIVNGTVRRLAVDLGIDVEIAGLRISLSKNSKSLIVQYPETVESETVESETVGLEEAAESIGADSV